MSTKLAVAVVVVIIIVAAALFFISSTLSGAPATTTSPTATLTTTATTTTTPSTVIVIVPKDSGINQNINFEPATVAVIIGINNTIRWVDQDPIPHTVTSTSVPSGASAFDSGTIEEGDTFEVTLTVPGTYSYFCTFHPGWMKATINVKAVG